MSDAMKTEQLQRGQYPAGLAEGGQSALGATHAKNAGFGEPRSLTPEDVKEMFGPATTPRQRLEAQGVEFVESEAETGGGGEGDPVEKYFVGGQGNLEAMGRFIEAQRQAGLDDEGQINAGGQPLCSFGDFQKIYDAIRAAQTRGDRRPIEEIVREARRPSLPPLEPQQTPRPADWRTRLPPDQRQRLQDFEAKIFGFDGVQLQILSRRLRELQALSLTDGWQSKEVQEKDSSLCLEIIAEKLQAGFPDQAGRLVSERLDPIQNLSADARAHVQFLTDKFKRDKNLEKLAFPDLVAYVQTEYKKAGLVGRNAPTWLLPPHLKGELLPVFGLSLEIPLPLEPKEKNART